MRLKNWMVLLALASSACVPKGKYNATLAELKKCQTAEAACSAERDGKIVELKDANGKLSACTKDLDTAKKSVGELDSSMQASKEELAQLRAQRAEAEKRLAAFRALTAKFQKMIDTGKIQVMVRNGRMLLKLPAGVLFASGKAELSSEGETALTEVATVLKDFPDRQFLVAGHTDNVPLGHSRYKNNWELSSARAVTVTQFLIEHGVAPTALAAAGYGEFDPVGDNKTEGGKQENRRIEIVLQPAIDELPKMPE